MQFRALIVFFGLAYSSLFGQTPKDSETFSAMDELAPNPVPIPPQVLRILLRDNVVQSTLAGEGLKAGQVPLTWFHCSAVQLASPKGRDLVIYGTGHLLGANVTTFWIFRQVAGHYELSLTIPTHTLHLLQTRSHGYRDLESLKASAVTTYSARFRFDGRRYQLAESSSQAN